ncbi:depupylase/deamidase Dop [Nostocoides australiense]
MGVERVMGIETEYGISLTGAPHANPMVLSGQVVTAYAQAHGVRAARGSWDYADEAPLRDARGFEMGRGVAHPSQLTDEWGSDDDPTLANVVLTNGARLYVDHAHPEYSSPEVTTPRAGLTWDRAGELVMQEAVRRLAASPPGINLYKNNTDGKGSSYGTHENYLMRRSTPFAQIVTHLTPFFVARQVMCGSGRVGIGVDSRVPGYQIAQRSDFFETEVGLETTLKRPIINTRDEPHATADKYRRLHVIIGDANHGDVAGLLKLGSTSLVLELIEADAVTDRLSVRHPVATLQAISHDPTLTHVIELEDGRKLTAVQLLWRYYEMVDARLDQTGEGEQPHTAEVMRWWADVLGKLERDPMSAAAEVDWVGKLRVLQAYQEREGLAWNDPKLKAIDIQWSDVRPDKGLFNKLRAAGRFTELIPEEEARRAVTAPPEDTRAYFRGRCLERFPDNVVAASWDSLILEVPGVRALRRVPMMEPLKGTRDAVGDLLDDASDVGELLAALAAAD